MNVGVVAPQSSHWDDSHRAASILAKALRRLGHRAWLITSVFHDGAPAVEPELVEKSERGFVELENDVAGVPALRVLSAKPLLPSGGVVLRNFSRILGEIVDLYGLDVVVVFSSFWNGPEEAAKWASVRRSLAAAGEAVRRSLFVYIPVYFTRFHVARPVEYASRVMWSTLNLPFILQQADLVVACCQQEAGELRQFKAGSEKIVESRSWVDPEFAEALNAAPADVPDGFDYIVSYVGPLREDRNISGLVKIADKLQALGRIAVVAAGSGEAAAKFKREAKNRRNVLTVESHDVRLLASVVKSSVAGVDLSLYEPMGIRALEYMYAGVPFAAPPTSRAAWYVADGVDGIHLGSADDVDGFVRWIAALVQRPEVREEMGRRAQKKAEGLTADKLAGLIVDSVRRL
ncbi:MAG: glycosyltransferase [Thermoproteus sp.]